MQQGKIPPKHPTKFLPGKPTCMPNTHHKNLRNQRNLQINIQSLKKAVPTHGTASNTIQIKRIHQGSRLTTSPSPLPVAFAIS